MRVFSSLIIMMSFLVLCSCGTYQSYSGYRLESTEEALLQINCPSVKSVDDSPLIDVIGPYKRISFKSGRHQISVQSDNLVGVSGNATAILNFVVLPGRVYALDCLMFNTSAAKYYIFDQKAKKTIASTIIK